MKLPNLFDYATSELSQDAFIAWLIKWADKDFQQADRSLNQCASSLVRELIDRSHNYEIEKVEVDRQLSNIDVYAKINDEYFIVIEDKKGSKEHSDQLNRYKEIVEKKYRDTNMNIVLVYFKMEEQGSYSTVEEAKYTIFGRAKMLSILGEYYQHTLDNSRNNILTDYYYYLKELDENINSFKTCPPNDWSRWYSWKGFYTFLKKELGGGNWDYVANPSGGFMGFWWNFHEINLDGKEFEVYLQLEEKKLTFKLYVEHPEDREAIRRLYREKLNEEARKMNIEIERSGRLGKYMTVAKLSEDYRVTDGNEKIDLSKTVEKLQYMGRLLDNTVKEINPQ